MQRIWQWGITAFVALLGAVFAIGASQLPSDGGYAGVGPSFIPWVVSLLLLALAALLAYQVITGGFRNFVDAIAGVAVDYGGGLWVTGGVLAMAALITRTGFVIAATVLFVCVARGFGSRTPLRDAMWGAVIVLPVFWLFTLVLDVNLPRLVNDWL